MVSGVDWETCHCVGGVVKASSSLAYESDLYNETGGLGETMPEVGDGLGGSESGSQK